MKQSSLILLVTLTVLTKEIASQSSPCPDIFKYQSDGQRNYGIITIPGPGVGRTVMQAKIGIRGRVYNKDSAGLKLLKSPDAVVEDLERGKNIQYILNFPRTQQLPTLIKLTLNNRDICRGPDVFNTATWKFQHEFTYPSGMTQLSNIPFGSPKLDLQNDPHPYPNNPWLNPRSTPSPTPAIPRSHIPLDSPERDLQMNPHPYPNNPWLNPRSTPPSPSAKPRVSAQPSDDGSWLNSLPYSNTCGRKSDLQATRLIIGGENVDVGEFPWMVALFHYQGSTPVYRCGASLISNTYVITAAHCTENQRKVRLELGKHNIANPNEEGYVTRNSLKIIQHPEYVPEAAHGDISLILIEHVEFTVKIRPICIWHYGTNLDNIFNKGTITGWGRLENYGDLSTTPMKLEVRTIGLDTCRNSHEILRNLATQKTFCARGNNSGPCHGDSGSGFYIIHKNVTYLRGIISTSLGRNHFECILSEYAVYADIASYLDWLRQYLI